MPDKGSVYLLCFRDSDEKGYVSHAGHYLGWAKLLTKRIKHHRAGTGAKLTRAAVNRGLTLAVVRVWPDSDRVFESRLKKSRNFARLCPKCNPQAYERRKPPKL